MNLTHRGSEACAALAVPHITTRPNARTQSLSKGAACAWTTALLCGLALMTGCARSPGALNNLGDQAPIVVSDLPGLASRDHKADTAKPRVRIVKRAETSTKRLGKSSSYDSVASSAAYHLKNATTGFRQDCSGFVMAVLHRVGVQTSGSVKHFWEQAEEDGRISRRKGNPGDLVFFDNTWDRNKNGKLDDDLTHIGIIMSIDPDGTMIIAHDGTSKGRTVLHMNLKRADEYKDGDKVLNSYLRRKKSTDKPGTPYLSGELFRGFATPPGVPRT